MDRCILNMFLLVLWTSFFLLSLSSEDQYHCYANISDPYLMFATFRAYEFVYERNTDPVSIEKCQPVQFWLLCRHGTRYPPDHRVASLQTLPELRDQIVNNHDVKQRGNLCDEDLENLKRWTMQVITPLMSALTPQGYDDLYKMGERYKSRFPTLLNQSYSQDKFVFQSTSKQRTAASAFAFAKGMFGTTSGIYFPEPQKVDMFLMPYANCPAWSNNVDLNPETAAEMHAFQDGEYMTVLLQNVSHRLGFDNLLGIDNVNAMYDGCRFDKAWNFQDLSPWCAVFSEEELKLMEYREDLLYYFYTGYGSDMNIRMGCPPVKDFLDRFSQIEQGNNQPAGVFYFTHSEMLQFIFTPLGIAKDQENLTHTNYEQMRNRQWRTSNNTPFAANFAAVFLKCDDGEPYKVQFYLNEHALDIEGCEQGLCNWSYIKQKFGSISSNCDFDFC